MEGRGVASRRDGDFYGRECRCGLWGELGKVVEK